MLSEGQRVGRFVIVRDVDGRLHAVAAGSVVALCAVEDETLLLLPGSRVIRTAHPLRTILAWLTVG